MPYTPGQPGINAAEAATVGFGLQPFTPPATYPEAIPTEEVVAEEEQPKVRINGGDDMSDLFEVPQPEDEDIATDDLFEADDVTELDIEEGENDLSDLFTVTKEDVYGRPRKVKPRYRAVRRLPPPLGGMQGIR